MGKVNIHIHNRDYSMECDDGQESHIQKMALQLDQKVRSVVNNVGNVGDIRLLVMTSILMADEIHELNERNLVLNEKLNTLQNTAIKTPLPANNIKNQEYEAVFAIAIEKVAKKIESLADKIKKN